MATSRFLCDSLFPRCLLGQVSRSKLYVALLSHSSASSCTQPTLRIIFNGSRFSESSWGMKLGQKVAAIRATGKYVRDKPKRRKTLETLGFLWRVRAASSSHGVDSDEGVTFEQLYDALVTYRREMKERGPLTVPTEFVVPNADPWPENTRGLPLGRSMARLRSKAFLKENPEAEQKLMALGFEWDEKEAVNDSRFQKVYSGLQRYKEIYGDLLVPQPFVIPEGSNDWPQDVWGLRLGARVNAIRSQGTFVKTDPEKRQLLEDLGFVWFPPQSERKTRGRRSSEEKEEEEEEEMKIAATRTGLEKGRNQLSQYDTGDFEEEEEEDFDSSFGSSFDFAEDSFEGGSQESNAPTWGLEANRDFKEVRATQEKSQKAAQNDYKPPKPLSESLREATERAKAAGIIEQSST